MTLDKKNSVKEIEDKKNLMITSDLNDKLRKDLTITPVKVNFGFLKVGQVYELKIAVKNEDVLA